MGELVIKYHDFENAKKEIKKFSEQKTTDFDLKRVNDSKDAEEFLCDWFLGRGIGLNHKVTGEELNELTSQIQIYLHSINNTQIELIREFGQVYTALEALDKDYIQAILISIKATEETSQGIPKIQEQIKKIVENQRKTIEELKRFKQTFDFVYKILDRAGHRIEELERFKQKFDGYAHLEDIDNMFGDLDICKTNIKKINDSFHVNDLYSRLKNVEEQTSNANLESLTKKVKYAYWIAGSSAVLAIVELILFLVKVI